MKNKNIEQNDEGVMSKNSKQLRTFALYCLEHPEERFWQALRNWSGSPFIYRSNGVIEDTFYE